MGKRGGRHKKRNLADDTIRKYSEEKRRSETKSSVAESISVATSPVQGQATQQRATITSILIIIVVGLVAFSIGLLNPFQGDDNSQIVNNPIVHSISNIGQFFGNSTFYNGQHLFGAYYRPLMTVSFSAIYTLFGAHTLPFHIFQLILCIGNAILLYLIFRYALGSLLALVLSLVFLVHPLNAQIVFAIPSTQDALYLFSGLLAFWILLRFQSVRSLWAVALCLLFSLLSKEMGLVFVLLTLVYVFWFDRPRFSMLLRILLLPMVIYLSLKINAVGLFEHSRVAPISNLSFGGRLLTFPSVLLFYISKFFIPWKLASGYYWTYTSFSVSHVLVPLLIDIVIVGGMVYVGALVRARLPKPQYYVFLFFALWLVVGIIPYLQIFPLDMTACNNWFYLAMIGMLGMVGFILLAFQEQIQPSWFIIAAVLITSTLGLRTIFWGHDWSSHFLLAKTDISASKQDFNAYEVLGEYYLNQGDYVSAKTEIQRSSDIFPTQANTSNLGVVLTRLGNYGGAIRAYERAMNYTGTNSDVLYQNLAWLQLTHGRQDTARQFLLTGTQRYPESFSLWECLALFDDKNNDNKDAKAEITKAASLGQVPSELISKIVNNQPFTLNIPSVGATYSVN